MVKKDIAHRLHQEAGISEKDAAALLDWFFELLKTTLQQGESILISNFGTFTVRSKNPRPGRNPRTGEGIMIAARRVVMFSASPRFKGEVNAAHTEQPKKAPAEREVTSMPSSYVLEEREE
jgi:integration host factor subunit alpha